MSIWFKEYTLEHINKLLNNEMMEYVGITFTEIGDDFLKGTMPVDHRTRQAMGLLHGGASAVLAESLGSVAGNLTVDPENTACVGLEINANHIRSATGGIVTGTARPFHLGSATQVWNIEICDDKNRLVCISRLTLSVLKRTEGKKDKFWNANPFRRLTNNDNGNN